MWLTILYVSGIQLRKFASRPAPAIHSFLIAGRDTRSMTQPGPTSAPAGRAGRAVAALLMLAMGLAMLLQGFGLRGAGWLNPNPAVPSWVFATLGIVLVLGALLAAGTLRPLPRAVAQGAGWGLLVLSLAVAHWLVFFADGASCSLAAGGLGATLSDLACRGLIGLALIALDLILLAALFGKPRAPRP